MRPCSPANNDDSFEPGSLAYNTFGPPSAAIWRNSSGFANTLLVATPGVIATPFAVTGGLTAASYAGGRALALYGGMGSSGIALGYQNMTQASYELDGLARLKVSDSLYNALNNQGLWMSLNRGYLDQAISQGSRIFQVSTSTPVYNSWYWWELQYLGQNGWR